MSSPKSSLSTPLPSVSHLGAVTAVTRKQDSAGLTATLSNYVNAQLMDHIAGWQTDTAEKQVLMLYVHCEVEVQSFSKNKAKTSTVE